jgi:hypothetical protein
MRKSVILLAIGIFILVIQLVPMQRTNPKVESEIVVAPEFRDILKRSCYDCHSNETVWPWYSKVAPASWLVVGHVNEGRSRLNFSTWSQYDASQQAGKLREMGEEIKEGGMPLFSYLLLHPKAKLSAADVSVVNKELAGR